MKTNKNQVKSIKYLILGILAVFVVVSSYYVSNYILAFKYNRQIELAVNQKPDMANAKTYTNKYGQEWKMSNPGKNVLNIGGRVTTGPNIVKAEIDPLKVAVGQKQYMKVEINSDKEITKVVAEITTDHKTVKVALKPTGIKELTYKDVTNAPFVIKDDGELVLKSDTSPSAKVAFSQMVNKLFDHAKAANTMRYSFAGDWIVHDTGETTYTTKFVAYDKDNQSNNVTLAWSDPCTLPVSNLDTGWPTQYSAQNNTAGHFEGTGRTKFIFRNFAKGTTCSTGQLTGIEGVDYEIFGNPNNGTDNYTLSIPNDTLVVTPGKKLFVKEGGRIVLDDSGNTDHSVGQIVKGYIWLKDEDGDGYFYKDTLALEYNQWLHVFTATESPPPFNGGGGGEIDPSDPPVSMIFNHLLSAVKYKINLVVSSFSDTAKAETLKCNATGIGKWVKKGSVDPAHNFLGTNPKFDCNDRAMYANSESGSYCDLPMSNGSFDYNCDGVAEKFYKLATPLNSGAISSIGSVWNECYFKELGDGNPGACLKKDANVINSLIDQTKFGFQDSIPSCGAKAPYLYFEWPNVNCSSFTAYGEEACITGGRLKIQSSAQNTQQCR